MSRPCSVGRGLARRRAGPAVALAGALGLAACSSAPEPPPPACPTALFLDGAEQTAVFTPGAGTDPRPDQLRYLAVLTDLTSTCRYDEDSSAPGVDVDLSPGGRLESQIARFKPYNENPNAPPLPDHIAEEMVNTVNGLRVYQEMLVKNRRDQAEIKTSFDSDIRRFKELKGIR